MDYDGGDKMWEYREGAPDSALEEDGAVGGKEHPRKAEF